MFELWSIRGEGKLVEVKFYDEVAEELLDFAVIISKTKGKWFFCKHKEREIRTKLLCKWLRISYPRKKFT